MNKAELVAAVAEKTNFTKKDAEAAVTATFDAITAALTEGDKVALVGFGTFAVKERAARTGLNPQTKEKIEIAETKAPAFKPSNSLKELFK